MRRLNAAWYMAETDGPRRSQHPDRARITLAAAPAAALAAWRGDRAGLRARPAGRGAADRPLGCHARCSALGAAGRPRGLVEPDLGQPARTQLPGRHGAGATRAAGSQPAAPASQRAPGAAQRGQPPHRRLGDARRDPRRGACLPAAPGAGARRRAAAVWPGRHDRDARRASERQRAGTASGGLWPERPAGRSTPPLSALTR